MHESVCPSLRPHKKLVLPHVPTFQEGTVYYIKFTTTQVLFFCGWLLQSLLLGGGLIIGLITFVLTFRSFQAHYYKVDWGLRHDKLRWMATYVHQNAPRYNEMVEDLNALSHAVQSGTISGTDEEHVRFLLWAVYFCAGRMCTYANICTAEDVYTVDELPDLSDILYWWFWDNWLWARVAYARFRLAI